MLPDDPLHSSWLGSAALVLWVLVVTMYLFLAVPETLGWIQSIDDYAHTLAVEGEMSPLVSAAEVLSAFGGTVVILPFAIIVGGNLYRRKRKLSLLVWVSALVVSELLIWTTKIIYARQRPPMTLVTTHSYSFPSGHAGMAAAVAMGVVLLLAVRGTRHWYVQLFALAYIVGIAWSRVYLRAHWLSDVVAGAALGAAVAISAYLLILRLAQSGTLPAGEVTSIGVDE